MPTPLDRFHRPAYTGENRCWPCTVLNTGLLAVLVAVIGIRGRRTLAAITAGIGLAAIGVRGYLVPYTPRLIPVDLGPFFNVTPANEGSVESDPTADLTAEAANTTPDGERVLTRLLEDGVVVEDDGIQLDPSFRTAWREAMMPAQDLDTLAAAVETVTPAGVSARPNVGRHGSYVVLEGPEGTTTSLPRAVAIADLAAVQALDSRVDDERVRLAAGHPLRSLLERCPDCDSPLTRTAATCCGEVTPIGSTPPEKLVCLDCQTRLFTY